MATDPFLGGSSSVAFGIYTIQQLPVSEPSTALLLGTGLLAFLAGRRLLLA